MDQDVESGDKLYVVCQRDVARDTGNAAFEETGDDETHYQDCIDASAHEKPLCIADALENGPGRRKYHLRPHGQRHPPETRYRGQPLLSVQDTYDLRTCEPAERSDECTQQRQDLHHLTVFAIDIKLILLVLRKDRMKHRGNHMREIVHRIKHQLVSLVVVTQLR